MLSRWFGWLVLLTFFAMPTAMSDSELFQHDGWLSLYNTHTNETLKITYLDSRGQIDPLALDAISYHLRCPYTNQTAELSPDLIVLMDEIQDFFGKDKMLSVISGYRTPVYNSRLRERSEGVARYSYHMQGKAADISIAGIDLQDVRTYASLIQKGGVGFYPGNFVHVDVGPVRIW